MAAAIVVAAGERPQALQGLHFSGSQFFGEVNIDAASGSMTVDLRDINGVSVFTRTLQPRMG